MRKYINVPFAEKDHAKQRGALWDKDKKKWYVPDGVSLLRFTRWMSFAPKNQPPLQPLSRWARKWDD